jgi:RNA recognition motif-containing protein
MNIYVGNLPYSATEDDLQDLFAAFGQVSSVSLIKDKVTGQARGFGFVEMPESAEAQKAIDDLNGKDFKGRSLVVNQARPREERGDRPSRGGYGGGGGGGYGGGGGGYGGGGNRGGGGYGDRGRSQGGGGRRKGQDTGRKNDW